MRPVELNLRHFVPVADGVTDDTPAFRRCFTAAAPGGTLHIPPGDYRLLGDTPLPLASRLTVSAYGARFHLPDALDDQARAVLFAGTDLTDLSWFGGHFQGHCFDPARDDNTWEPNANTRPILLTTTPGGTTQRLTFRDLTSDHIAGAVVTVLGAEQPGSDSEIETYAEHVSVESCTFLASGKFMWDYGYLWQIVVWPEDYGERKRALAQRYFRWDLVRGPLQMGDGDELVRFANDPALPLSSGHNGHDAVCFYGDRLPANVVRGRQYFVVDSTPAGIRIAAEPGGEPLRFDTSAGPETRLIADLFAAHLALYAPAGAGPGKGAVDLVGCRHVTVRGCRLSALGDSMHIQKCDGVIFANNHIVGSRMGAFFLAEYCRNATITGNTVDGTNGSRVMSVEKSCTDVTILGNTFRNGGRGSWINQPRNLVMQGNLFLNTTTKCERDPHRGRRSFVTGEYEQYAELYFTTHEPGGRYGNVIVRDNVFVTGPEAADTIRFAAGGETVLVEGNVFGGAVRSVVVEEGCEAVVVRGNVGLQ